MCNPRTKRYRQRMNWSCWHLLISHFMVRQLGIFISKMKNNQFTRELKVAEIISHSFLMGQEQACLYVNTRSECAEANIYPRKKGLFFIFWLGSIHKVWQFEWWLLTTSGETSRFMFMFKAWCPRHETFWTWKFRIKSTVGVYQYCQNHVTSNLSSTDSVLCLAVG